MGDILFILVVASFVVLGALVRLLLFAEVGGRTDRFLDKIWPFARKRRLTTRDIESCADPDQEQ